MRDLTDRVETMARAVYQELLARLDLHLGEPGLLLPDIIDIGRKQEFERKTVPQLREAIAQGRFKNLDNLLDWLRGEVAAMTPGADPLPALRASVAHLCRQWENELGGAPLLSELAAWAGRGNTSCGARPVLGIRPSSLAKTKSQRLLPVLRFGAANLEKSRRPQERRLALQGLGSLDSRGSFCGPYPRFKMHRAVRMAPFERRTIVSDCRLGSFVATLTTFRPSGSRQCRVAW